MKIVFVGGGTMAQAIISSLISSNKKFEITVSDPILKVRNEIKKKFGLFVTDNNLLAIKNSDLIILCIKPQNFKIVANEIYGKITNDQTIVSIMAGININTISKAPL